MTLVCYGALEIVGVIIDGRGVKVSSRQHTGAAMKLHLPSLV